MADRTVTARLRLVYDEFTKGTKAAAQGLKGVGDEAKKTSQSAGRDWSALGQSVSNLGSSMTTRLTLPIVGLGVVATKAAGDFDAAFVQMQTLAGVSADEVDGLKESVLGLAGETGKAPQELAEAMFFLQSSGLDAAGAMEALEISAKASAAGLGETQVLADAVSSTMLAYAESGMTAAEAMDTLVATARAGKAEPAAIAGQLSKLIPISAALDISFQDVGGALAALSTKAFSAEQGATGLAAVMSKLQKPSQQAQEQLDAVGLSGDRLKELLAEKGLLGTLTTLKERLGDNGFVRFLEDQEAIRAGVALTTGDMEKMEDIFGQVADSAGATEEAFGTWAESMGAKNARAFADFQIALIKLGDAIAPLAADLMSFAADIAGIFGDLPDPIQKVVVGLLAALAAAGPLVTIAGKMMSAWGAVTKLLASWTSAGGQAFADAMNNGASSTNNAANAMGRLRTGLINAAIGITVLEGIGHAVDAIDPVKTANLSKLERDLLRFSDSGRVSGEASRALGADFEELADAMHRVGEPSNAERLGDVVDHIVPGIENSQHNLKEARRLIDDVDQALATLAARDPEAAAAAFEGITEALEGQGISAEKTEELLDQYSSAVAQTETANEAAQGGAEGTTEAMADQEQAVNEAAEAHRNYADTIAGIIDPVFGLMDALRGNQEAQRGVVEAQEALDVAIRDHGRNSGEAAEATLALQDAMLGVGDSALDVTTAAANLNAAVAENPALVESALDALQTWRDQGIIPTDEQLRFLQDQIRRTALEGAALDQTDPHMDVTESGSRTAREKFAQVEHAAERIPSRRNTSVTTSGTARAHQQIRDFVDRILGIPTSRTVMLNIVSNNIPGGGFLGVGNNAAGGPVAAGEATWVGEQGPELLVMGNKSGHIYNQAQLASLTAPMTPAATYAGVGATVININMGRGVFVGTRREFKQAVQQAVNEVNRKGRGFNAA